MEEGHFQAIESCQSRILLSRTIECDAKEVCKHPPFGAGMGCVLCPGGIYPQGALGL